MISNSLEFKKIRTDYIWLPVADLFQMIQCPSSVYDFHKWWASLLNEYLGIGNLNLHLNKIKMRPYLNL